MWFGLCCVFLAALSTTSAHGQSERPAVRISLTDPEVVRVSIRSTQALGTWSFLNSYGPAIGPGERVRKFNGVSASGQIVSTKRIAAGVFRADHEVQNVSYELKLTATDGTPHLSAATPDYTLLMLADLLPREVVNLRRELDVACELPPGWTIHSAVERDGVAQFSVKDASKAVFLAGPKLRATSKTVDGMRLELLIAGDLPFKEKRALNAAARVLKTYLELTRFKLPNTTTVFIARLPSAARVEKWLAEARGSTVVLLFDPTANPRNWIRQLEIIFTHELLHLWMPNSLTLQGSYDWFFEGFTLYQALLTALDLKLISFNEYLNTLGRVYDSYVSTADTLSLLEASEQRWASGSLAVYDKAMLLAFLYDLERRYETDMQYGLSDRYAELFRLDATNSSEANEAIMSVLISSAETEKLLQSYVTSRQRLTLDRTLNKYGLVLESDGRHTKLQIASNATKNQLRLLRSLGYRR